MGNKLYEENDIQAIANAIRAKGQSGTMKVSQMPSKINAISTKENITWHQCPQLVRDYLANVTYNPNDYSTSQIANYAPATAVASNTKPIGKTVDGVTYYNEVPNVKTPFASTNKAGTVKPLDSLRWINSITQNVRDLGGWQCDGGTVKYGMLFRGGEPSASDKSLMVEKIGIKHELQLRGTSEAPQQYSVWGVDFSCPTNYVWMSISDTDTWREILQVVIENVIHSKPVYFHCFSGADRTGTVAVMLEGILGVSQSDIDKDYELTCFTTGTGSDVLARRRNESEYQNYIAAITALSGSTFMEKCINFAVSCGITVDDLRAFRAAMIDGTPSAISPSVATYSVANTLSHVTSDNASATATQYQPYEAEIIPESGYEFDAVSLTMGGSNIKASCYTEEKYPSAKGKIYIPKVTGNIALTASAIMPIPTYTNQIPLSVDTDGTVYNTTGFKTSTRINSSALPVDFSSGSIGVTGFIPVKKGDIIRFKNCAIYSGYASAASFNVAQYDANKAKLTNGGVSSWANFTAAKASHNAYWWQNMQFDDNGYVTQFELINDNVKYIRFTLLNVTADSVITVNEVIE